MRYASWPAPEGWTEQPRKVFDPEAGVYYMARDYVHQPSGVTMTDSGAGLSMSGVGNTVGGYYAPARLPNLDAEGRIKADDPNRYYFADETKGFSKGGQPFTLTKVAAEGAATTGGGVDTAAIDKEMQAAQSRITDMRAQLSAIRSASPGVREEVSGRRARRGREYLSTITGGLGATDQPRVRRRTLGG